MAGLKITVPAAASTDWSDFVTITGHARRHMMFVSFTNTTSTGAPAIEEGSYAMVNGTMYCLTPSTGGNETISTTGLSTGFTDGELWIKSIPSTGTSITSEYTTVAPTWSASKGGYYSTGNDKYIGGVFKTTGRYLDKWAYREGQKFDDGETRPIIRKELNIGVWDMDSTGGAAKNVDHNLNNAFTRIKNVYGIIKNDNGSAYHKIYYMTNAADPRLLSGGISQWSATGILLRRRTGGAYDTGSYDSTTIDRGDLIMEYKG